MADPPRYEPMKCPSCHAGYLVYEWDYTTTGQLPIDIGGEMMEEYREEHTEGSDAGTIRCNSCEEAFPYGTVEGKVVLL